MKIEDAESNFPRVFKVWFVEKARELARQCVEPPLKPKPKDPPFKKSPSLLRYVVVSRVDYPFCINYARPYLCPAKQSGDIPNQACQAVP